MSFAVGLRVVCQCGAVVPKLSPREKQYFPASSMLFRGGNLVKFWTWSSIKKTKKQCAGASPKFVDLLKYLELDKKNK